jgi:hypothetical protein
MAPFDCTPYWYFLNRGSMRQKRQQSRWRPKLGRYTLTILYYIRNFLYDRLYTTSCSIGVRYDTTLYKCRFADVYMWCLKFHSNLFFSDFQSIFHPLRRSCQPNWTYSIRRTGVSTDLFRDTTMKSKLTSAIPSTFRKRLKIFGVKVRRAQFHQQKYAQLY